MSMNLATRFAESAARQPGKPAVFDDGGTHTYAEILAAAQGLAAGVQRASTRPHVGILAPTSVAFPIAYFGVLLAGRAAVPLNYLLDPATLGLIVRDAELDVIVASRAFGKLAPALGAKVIYVEDTVSAAHSPGDGSSAAQDLSHGADAAATILYTSGTTGLPKGVVLTHRNLICNVEAANRHLTLSAENVFLGVLPFFHAFGITTSMLLPFLLGCSTVCVARFSPQKVLELIASHRVTIAFAVSSIYRMLVRAGRPAGLDLGSLQLPIAGGEALGADLSARFEAVFGVPLLEGYGMTETAPVVATNVPGQHRPGSVGQLLPWAEARIVDERDVPLPAGAEGELHLRGECVTPGYHNRPEESAAAFAAGGWLRTGDLARLDADGYLWITGRKKDLIISSGENISPSEIEAWLHQHPAVAEAAVVAVADESRGEVPKAFVVLRDGAVTSAADLAAYLKERLPRFKVPAAWEFRAELPHGATGKVLKRELHSPPQSRG